MPAPLIAAAIPIIGQIIDRVFPDKEAADKAKLELITMQQRGELQELEVAAQIITAEAGSESWLTRSWRPLVMLWLMVLLTFWFLGLAPPIVDTYIEGFLRLLTVGIGGYVFGRSAEKFAKSWKRK